MASHVTPPAVNRPLSPHPRSRFLAAIAAFVAIVVMFTGLATISPASAQARVFDVTWTTDATNNATITLVFGQDPRRAPATDFSVSLGSGPGAFIAGSGDSATQYRQTFDPLPPGSHELTIRTNYQGTVEELSGEIVVGGPVRNLTATALPDGKSFDLTWLAPEFDTPTNYNIKVTGTFSTDTFAADGNATSLRVSGLDNVNDEYRIEIKANYQFGSQTSSIVRRSADLAPPAPTDVTATRTGPTSIVVTWNHQDAQDARSRVTSFTVLAGSLKGDNRAVQVDAAEPNTVTFTNLPFDDEVVFTVAARNNFTSTSASPTARVATGAATPGSDTVKPEIELSVAPTASRYAARVFPTFSCTDNVEIAICTSSHPNGVLTDRIGPQTVEIYAEDVAGNTARESATVVVDWKFTGQFAGVEGNNAIVARFYAATFGRLPDQGGYDYWVNRLDTEPDGLQSASEFFTTSPEFKTLYGLNVSNEQFVDTIYVNVLGRAPEGAGRTFWIESLTNGTHTRGSVMAFFANSPEHMTITGTK